MSLHTLASEQTKEQLESLGKVSTAIKTAGVHPVKIVKAFNTTGEKDGNEWNSVTVEFVNSAGETARINEFMSTPKTNSQEDIDKANRGNTRVMGIMTRLAKAVGIPDLKAATSGYGEETDDKGRAVAVYPKYKGKELNIVTTTEITADDKDPSKVYVKQIVDTSKFLDKDGKDALGRDCIESFDVEAKGKIEIGYKYTANPACISKLSQLQEQNAGTAPAPLTGMPTAAATTSTATETDDDI